MQMGMMKQVRAPSMEHGKKAGIREAEVLGRGSEAAMTKENLNGAHVGTGFQQMDGKCVPQGMACKQRDLLHVGGWVCTERFLTCISSVMRRRSDVMGSSFAKKGFAANSFSTHRQ
jgi:hypothetical protein